MEPQISPAICPRALDLLSYPCSMNPRAVQFSVTEEVWPMDRPFRISRGSRTEARVIVVTVTDGKYTGRGESVPSKRYHATSASTIVQLEEVFPKVAAVPDRKAVNELLPPGAARNAVDCALWDFEAKRSDQRVWELVKMAVAPEVITAFTISLDTPDAMAENARSHRDAPILKLKLSGDHLDLSRV